MRVLVYIIICVCGYAVVDRLQLPGLFSGCVRSIRAPGGSLKLAHMYRGVKLCPVAALIRFVTCLQPANVPGGGIVAGGLLPGDITSV